MIKFDAMASQNWSKLACASPKFRERMAIGVLGELAPLCVAKDIGEEHYRIASARLEQHQALKPGSALV